MTRWLTPADLSSPDEETALMSREKVEALARTSKPSNDDEITADVTDRVEEVRVEEVRVECIDDDPAESHAALDRRRRERRLGKPVRAMALVVGMAVAFVLGGMCAVDHYAKTPSGVRR